MRTLTAVTSQVTAVREGDHCSINPLGLHRIVHNGHRFYWHDALQVWLDGGRVSDTSKPFARKKAR